MKFNEVFTQKSIIAIVGIVACTIISFAPITAEVKQSIIASVATMIVLVVLFFN